MTLAEFRYKRKNIEETHPAPEGLNSAQKVRYYAKIAFEWIEQLNLTDGKVARQEERALTEQALS
ncbi:MAG TPA: hypothetical protein VKZ97_01985 [Flavobacteriaceae bacterium]|nr:hypothetical protein [Flavobacteriaceae bacterium]